MTVTVLFFAQAREQAGRPRLSLDLADGGSVADLMAAVLREVPSLAPLAPHLAVAVDGRLSPAAARVPAGAEVALLPPVSGG
jgi:molybdopterin converting factor small subunit